MSRNFDPDPKTPKHQRGPASKPPARKTWIIIVQAVLLTALLVWVIRLLIQSFNQIDWSSIDVNWLFVTASIGCLLLANLTKALGLGKSINSIGSAIEIRRLITTTWISSLGRYVPGKFAAPTVFVYVLRKNGIPATVGIAALLLTMGIRLVLGMVAASPFLVVYLYSNSNILALIGIALLTICMIVALLPNIFPLWFNFALKCFKRTSIPGKLQIRSYGSTIVLNSIHVCLLAAALWCSAHALQPIVPSDYLLALATVGLSTIGGLIVIFAPAGIGVREAVILFAFEPSLGATAALVAVLFRLLQVLTDCICGVVALIMMQRAPSDDPASQSTTAEV